MFSLTARYALQILGDLARRPGERARSEEIAARCRIPNNYLSKILAQLRKQGIVDAVKGWGGGFRVRPEALDRPIADVVAIFDGPPPDPAPCVFGQPECDSRHPCPLHGHWERIRAIQDDMMSSVRIGDLGREAPPTSNPA